MKHPLDYFISISVRDLLSNLYVRNFIKAGADGSLASDMIAYIWENKDTKTEEELYQYIRSMYRQARRQRNIKTLTETPAWELFDLDEYEAFLDIGANTLFTINLLSQRYNEMKFIGVDIIAQQKPFYDGTRSQYFQLSPHTFSLPLENNSLDIVNAKFVFHHFKSLVLIEAAIKEAARLLRPGGIFILWEESYEDIFMGKHRHDDNISRGIETDYELTYQFYALSAEQRLEFIIINDWLINFGHTHIPWTYQYLTWSQWIDIFKGNNFSLEYDINFGLRANGLLSQGVHMLGVFKKD